MLSDCKIRELMANGRLVIDPMPEDRCFQPASVDLRLSDDFLFGTIHPSRDGDYTMVPDEFILGSTIERIEIPVDIAARVEGKSTLARRGLMVHVTAGFIDPGFKGNITLELKNVGPRPILLREGMHICQISFCRVEGRVARPYGSKGLGSKYQESVGTVGPRLRK